MARPRSQLPRQESPETELGTRTRTRKGTRTRTRTSPQTGTRTRTSPQTGTRNNTETGTRNNTETGTHEILESFPKRPRRWIVSNCFQEVLLRASLQHLQSSELINL
ncbi:hypothetical protein M758_9G068400 [Ceratodon purpureus]|nr:hypothetical protein M758_9G068400 [Ceratodon purpureus]